MGGMIGLTATPANYIDRDTFLAFDCADGKPTYLYTYEQAIEDGYLVDFDLYAARTKFQRQGIHGVDLSEEERNSLIEQGIDPDDIDYEGTELEQTVSNRDTLRKQWEEIMEVCLKDASGQLPGKTIVFAMTQEHALRLEEVFDEMYPQFPGLAQGHHPQIRIPRHAGGGVQEERPAAHRHLGGHARYGHRRARSGQPGLHEAGAVADQAAADDRARHALPGGLLPSRLAAELARRRAF